MPRSSRTPDPEPSRIDASAELSELRASRARLLAEAYAGRRRIEGSLHDGVQQHLVALVVNLQLARQLAETDPPALSPILDEIARDVREALESVRELAHEIYPPLLLDRGLTEAIGAGASASPLSTRVEVALLERFPEVIEATAYFCCIDVLSDAATRGATGATIRIWEDGSTLNFAITHDGRPLDPARDLRASTVDSIRDRINAVGGRLTATSRPAGDTRVLGTIPLEP